VSGLNLKGTIMKFKCIATGCVYEFTQPVDIETTLQNPAYTVVEETHVEVVEAVEVATKSTKKAAVKNA
jgi:hypothetical protein